MGVLEQLGYEVKPANAVQRVVQRIVVLKPMSLLFQRTLYPIDKRLHRWTNGRVTLPGLLAGLPVVLLTTTGARTGRARTMPVLGIPVGDQLAVIGSNYGTERSPGWAHNLAANPAATVEWRGRSVDVRARLADDDETERIFADGTSVYSGYPKYRERTDRSIPVFVLETSV